MKSFQCNEVSIPLGTSFSETVSLLSHVKQFTPYPAGWANLHLHGTTIYGMKCPRIEVRAPFADRPVMQVIYQLSPLSVPDTEGLHSGFMKVLESQLGAPKKTSSYYDKNDWRKGLSQYGVAFTATWETGDVRISLSVYGGNRNDESGQHAAGLYINWIDEIKAAAPYRIEMRRLGEQVAQGIANAEHLKKLTLLHRQNPFAIHHHENPDPKEADHNPELRAAQLALYRRDIFPTPAVLSEQLSDYEICIYRIPGSGRTFISKKHDTVFIADGEKVSPVFYEVQPARGPGGREIYIKELYIDDAGYNNALLDLAQWLERISGIQTVMSERMDD